MKKKRGKRTLKSPAGTNISMRRVCITVPEEMYQRMLDYAVDHPTNWSREACKHFETLIRRK